MVLHGQTNRDPAGSRSLPRSGTQYHGEVTLSLLYRSQVKPTHTHTCGVFIPPRADVCVGLRAAMKTAWSVRLV